MLLVFVIIANYSNIGFGLSSSSHDVSSSLKTALLRVNSNISLTDISYAANDYGNIVHNLPLAVLHPASVEEIADTLKLVSLLGPVTGLQTAASGERKCIRGQSQVKDGVVINMRSNPLHETRVNAGGSPPYVDVSGGETWINLLNETLKYGLAPRSWTDYIHLTVGGTLSNSGISGQAFRHGPQTSNVLLLEVVTGNGEILNCSATENADLFNAVRGGLGQFGVITMARIVLEPAPQKVKLIRALYSNFTEFSRDQEFLITSNNTFDYIQGMVQKNSSDEPPGFRLEVAKYFNNIDDPKTVTAEIQRLLSNLSFIPSTLTITESTYVEFLERVYTTELFLRSIGLWEGGDVAHLWLELFVPQSKIQTYASQVFSNIVSDTNTGPILVYPFNKSKFDNKTSLVFPDEDIFYLTSFLPRTNLTSNGTDGLEKWSIERQKILDFCESVKIEVYQYFPFYETQEEYKEKHYGPERWKVLSQRKSKYDTSCTLAPGHNIFNFTNCPGLTTDHVSGIGLPVASAEIYRDDIIHKEL